MHEQLSQKSPPIWFCSRAFTLGSAYASFDETRKGSIEIGKLADFAILSADILKINPVELEKTRVVMTIFDGKVVYELGK